LFVIDGVIARAAEGNSLSQSGRSRYQQPGSQNLRTAVALQ